MNRKIKFKGLLTAGDNKEINVLVSGVVVYDSQTLGCSLDSLRKALEDTEWTWDGLEFIRNDAESDTDVIDGELFGVSQMDEWVYFKGIPLQFTGECDTKDNEIYEGAILRGISYKDPLKCSKTVIVIGVVRFHYGNYPGFQAEWKLINGARTYPRFPHTEVLGNVHTTPELMPAVK